MVFASSLKAFHFNGSAGARSPKLGEERARFFHKFLKFRRLWLLARARTEIPHNNSNVEAERQVQTPPPDQTTILTEAGGEACYKHTAITTSV